MLDPDAELWIRLAREDPKARAARRAHERWTAIRRVWAAMDRLAMSDDGQRLRFLCQALWPSLRREDVEVLVARASNRNARPAWVLRRPTRAEDVLGERAATLMRNHAPGSETHSADSTPTAHRQSDRPGSDTAAHSNRMHATRSTAERKRELIDRGPHKRYIRRNDKGQFTTRSPTQRT